MIRRIPLLLIFRDLLSYPNLRGFFGVKDEFLEVPSIDKFLELLSERPTVDCVIAHPVMECTISVSFEVLRVRWKWSQTPQSGLVLDGAENPINGGLERSEVSIDPVDLNGVLDEIAS